MGAGVGCHHAGEPTDDGGSVRDHRQGERCHRPIWHTWQVEPDVDAVAGPRTDNQAPRSRSAGSAVLGAAMKGLGMVIDPDKVDVQIEFAAPSDPEDDPVPMDFGDLPPLT